MFIFHVDTQSSKWAIYSYVKLNGGYYGGALTLGQAAREIPVQLDLGLRVSEPRIETVFSEKMVWLLLESKLQHVIKFRHIYIYTNIQYIYTHISMDPSTV